MKAISLDEEMSRLSAIFEEALSGEIYFRSATCPDLKLTPVLDRAS